MKLSAYISLVLLLMSIRATALNCPSSDDFIVDNVNVWWGWTWKLRPALRTDFTVPEFTWFFYSPSNSNKKFSPDYPLTAELFIEHGSNGISSAIYSCAYELEGGEKMLTQYIEEKSLDEDEFEKIKNTWKQGSRGSGEFVGGWGYECKTTAGTPEKCSFNFIN